MTLLARLSRLFRADVHAVLDNIEEPEVLLRQAIREMEEALDKGVQRSRKLEWDRQRLLVCQVEIKQNLAAIDAEMDLCFTSDKEDLVRTLIRRKLELEHKLKMMDANSASLEEELAGLRRQVAEQQTTLDTVRQQAEVLAAQQKYRSEGVCQTTPATLTSAEDIEIALLREKQKRGLS